jgi:hypothetical protein
MTNGPCFSQGELRPKRELTKVGQENVSDCEMGKPRVQYGHEPPEDVSGSRAAGDALTHSERTEIEFGLVVHKPEFEVMEPALAA